MLLCVDVGNTNILIGLFHDSVLQQTWRLSTRLEATVDEHGLRLWALLERAGADPDSLTGIALCSVVPQVTQVLAEMCRWYLQRSPFIVDASVSTGMPILVDRPHEVGADRLVNCVAARQLFPGPACVVDFGTATKFDVISAEGAFLGGAIAPGIGIAADALFSRASKLFRVPLQAPPRVIGRNSDEAMLSGVVLGYLALVEGMIGRLRSEVGQEMRVVATGGLAPVIVDALAVFDRVEPWLTLEGLRLIWDRNHTLS
jgi:type III pantothenate kinase